MECIFAQPDFQAQGWNDSPFNLYPVKGRYMWRDLERTAMRTACHSDLRRSSRATGYSPRALPAVSQVQAWTPAFVRAVYHVNFAEDQDIADRRVIAACLRRVNQDAETVLHAANSAETKTMLREQTERAMELGIFGAPSFIAGHELFWEMIDWKKL